MSKLCGMTWVDYLTKGGSAVKDGACLIKMTLTGQGTDCKVISYLSVTIMSPLVFTTATLLG